MVEDRAVERVGCCGQSASGHAIRLARSGVAARVIVRENDTDAVVSGGVGDDGAKRQIRACFIALVARYVDAMRLVADMGDPQAFER